MSVTQGYHQLQQDLQNELTISNQLLHLIAKEFQQIKEFTSPGGKFEENIREVAATTQETMRNFMISTRILKIYPRLKETYKQLDDNHDFK